MTKVPGVSLGSIDYRLDREQRVAVASWTGDFIRRLQSIALSDEERSTGWATFMEVAGRRYAEVERLSRDRGFSEAFVARLRDWLPSIESLLGDPAGAMLCHGDLNSGNLLGRPAEPLFEVQGVIDFNQSFVGHPLADIGAIWWHILDRETDALEAYLASAGVEGTRRPSSLAERWRGR